MNRITTVKSLMAPHSSVTVGLDKTTEDNTEKANVPEFFNEEPCFLATK